MQTIWSILKGVLYVVVGLLVVAVVLGLLTVAGVVGAFLIAFGWAIVLGIIALVLIISAVRELFSGPR